MLLGVGCAPAYDRSGVQRFIPGSYLAAARPAPKGSANTYIWVPLIKIGAK